MNKKEALKEIKEHYPNLEVPMKKLAECDKVERIMTSDGRAAIKLGFPDGAEKMFIFENKEVLLG